MKFQCGIQKGLSDESIKLRTVSNNSLPQMLNYINTKLQVYFDWGWWKQENITFTCKNLVNIYIVY